MRFRSKLRQVGNSQGVLIPKQLVEDYLLGEEIELEICPKTISEDMDNIKEATQELFKDGDTKTENSVQEDAGEPQVGAPQDQGQDSA